MFFCGKDGKNSRSGSLISYHVADGVGGVGLQGVDPGGSGIRGNLYGYTICDGGERSVPDAD